MKNRKIKDVAVIGIPDKRLGEATLAIISLKDNMEMMNQVYEEALLNNSFYFSYTNYFICLLFGNTFSIGELYISSAECSVDINDLKQKISTYQPGDIRNIKFNMNDVPLRISLFPNDIRKTIKESRTIRLSKFKLNVEFLKQVTETKDKST